MKQKTLLHGAGRHNMMLLLTRCACGQRSGTRESQRQHNQRKKEQVFFSFRGCKSTHDWTIDLCNDIFFDNDLLEAGGAVQKLKLRSDLDFNCVLRMFRSSLCISFFCLEFRGPKVKPI